MDTKKLSEILPHYLGTELKGIFTHLPNNRQFEMKGINFSEVEDFGEEVEVTGVCGVYGGETSFIGNFKPMLRSLNKLTELTSIDTYNQGNPFIPLLEIAYFLGIRYNHYEIAGNSIDFVLSTKYMRENTKTKELRKARFWFSGHSFNITRYGKMIYFNQLGAIQLLFKWHFNVFNLDPEFFIEIEEKGGV